jgi:hypothetical protein
LLGSIETTFGRSRLPSNWLLVLLKLPVGCVAYRR